MKENKKNTSNNIVSNSFDSIISKSTNAKAKDSKEPNQVRSIHEKIKFLNYSEILELAESAKKERDRILILLLFETGCTINEASHIRIRDIEKYQIRFPAKNTRNNISKVSKISKELSKRLTIFIGKRKLIKKTGYLFEARINKNMTTKRLRQIIQETGISEHVKISPQKIRYSHLVHAMKKAIPLTIISKQTGIKKSRLVQIFANIEYDKIGYNRFFSDV